MFYFMGILKTYMKLNWNFQRGRGGGRGGVSHKIFLPWGKNGYFLELQIVLTYRSLV